MTWSHRPCGVCSHEKRNGTLRQTAAALTGTAFRDLCVSAFRQQREAGPNAGTRLSSVRQARADDQREHQARVTGRGGMERDARGEGVQARQTFVLCCRVSVSYCSTYSAGSSKRRTPSSERTPNFGLRSAAFHRGRWRVKWLGASWCTLAAQQGGRVPCHQKRCVMGKSGEPTHTSTKINRQREGAQSPVTRVNPNPPPKFSPRRFSHQLRLGCGLLSHT